MPQIQSFKKDGEKPDVSTAHPIRWFFSQGLFAKTSVLTIVALLLVAPILFNLNSQTATKGFAAPKDINTYFQKSQTNVAVTVLPKKNMPYDCLLISGQHCSLYLCSHTNSASGTGKCPITQPYCCAKPTK